MKTRRILSLILSVVMMLACVAIIPVSAADGDPVVLDFTDANTIKIHSGNYDENLNAYTATSTAGIQFAYYQEKLGSLSTDLVYIKILYSITGTSGNNKILMASTGNGNHKTEINNLSATDGKLVVSDTYSNSVDIINRLNQNSGYKVALSFTPAEADATFAIKAIYLFNNKADADAFGVDDGVATAPAVIGYQTTLPYGDATAQKRNLRFVAKGFDSDLFAEVGFKITVEGSANEWEKSSTTVYKKLSAQTADGTAIDSIEAANYGAEYLFAFVVNGAPLEANTFYVQPFAITTEGERIDGIKATVAVKSCYTVLDLSNHTNVKDVEVKGGGEYNAETKAYEFTSGEYIYFAYDVTGCGALSTDWKYMRIAYTLTGTTNSDHRLEVVRGDDRGRVTMAVVNPSDTFTLTDTYSLANTTLIERFNSGAKTYVMFNNQNAFKGNEGTLSVKAIYLFETEAAANAFALPNA